MGTQEANPPKAVVVILVDDTTMALQKLAKAYRDQLNMKVVGVTGSNGKTSTKDILASVLAKHFITQKTLGNFNNEIGVPLTLLSLSENCEAAVVEMGMENLQELSFLTKIVRRISLLFPMSALRIWKIWERWRISPERRWKLQRDSESMDC